VAQRGQAGDEDFQPARTLWDWLQLLVIPLALAGLAFLLNSSQTNRELELMQAEQQVMDWLSWVERYGGLARRDLPELQRPSGYVVIGRDEDLSEADGARLMQRNVVFGGAIVVMTYDGLLRRASALLKRLEGLASASAASSAYDRSPRRS